MTYRHAILVPALMLALASSTVLATPAFAETSNPPVAQLDASTPSGVTPGQGLIMLDNGRLALGQLQKARDAVSDEDAATARFFLRSAKEFLAGASGSQPLLGQALARPQEDIESADAALVPDNTGPTMWNGARVAIDSALQRLSWITSRAGEQALLARDLIAYAQAKAGSDDKAARYSIGQADVRFQLDPQLYDLSRLAGRMVEAGGIDPAAIDNLLQATDEKIEQLAKAHADRS